VDQGPVHPLFPRTTGGAPKGGLALLLQFDWKEGALLHVQQGTGKDDSLCC